MPIKGNYHIGAKVRNKTIIGLKCLWWVIWWSCGEKVRNKTIIGLKYF